MAAVVCKFQVRDPLRTCWTCEHVQIHPESYFRTEGPPPWEVEPRLIGRICMCSEKAVTVSASVPQTGIGYPQTPGYTIGGPHPIFLARQILIDGSKNWCSQWRQSSLPIPALPPLPI